jgi:signal transduction histidine kinase/DNA-binding response OmpR family regulator
LLNIFGFAFFLEPGKLMEYFLMIVPTMSLLIFDNKWLTRGILLLSILCFFVPNIYFQNEQILDVPITKVVLFVGFYVNFSYLKNLNLKNESLLQEQKDLAIADKDIIENQKRELEQLQEFQNRFFINVAHEIRTPITILKGNSKLLFQSIANPTIKQVENIEEVENQSRKIQRILDDVLDLTKMSQVGFELKKGKFDLIDSISKSTASFQNLFLEKEMFLVCEFDSSETYLFFGSNIYFERTINNLLSNAYKFSPKGGRVNVTLDKKEREFTIEVSDEGIGIKEWEKGKIFDRFYQSENSINKAGGSGVGLAFCKEAIDLHRGVISVRNNQDKGATFIITLPRNVDDEEETFIDNEYLDLELVPTVNVCKILLVEDLIDMRRFLCKILEGHNITEASNGLEAIETLKNHKFDLVITDYMMPQMDGYQMIKELRSTGFDTPIIMLTARQEQEAKLEVLRMGVDDFITKPFDEQELLVRVNNILFNQNRKEVFLKEEALESCKEMSFDFVQEMTSYVVAHCKESSFGLSDLCEEFALSNSSLYRKVKACTGLSPKEFVTEIRLKEAYKIKTANLDIHIKLLALEVGFVNYTHFCKLYERRFGVELKQNHD